MPAPLFTRAPKRVALGFATAALLVVTGCGAKDSPPTATPATTIATPPTTTTAAPTSTAAPTTTASPTTTSTTTSTTAPAKKEVGNTDIKLALEASSPDLWALVVFDYMSWDAFGGFNIPLTAGADRARAVELCDAVSKVVYEGNNDETRIVIAVDVSADDISGRPIVERANKAGACAAL